MPIADDVGSEQFEVRVEHEGDTCSVRLIGELDLATAEEARAAIEEAEDSGAETIVVDIDGLRFVDSTGLGLFLEVARHHGGGNRLRFTRGKGKVTELLDLTGLDEALPFTDSQGA